MQEFWQRPVLPQLAAEIEYVMGMTMRRRMRKRGNIWMRKARMMMRKKEKDYDEHDQGGDDESERLFCSQRFIEGKHSMSDY